MVNYTLCNKEIAERVFVGEVKSHSRDWLRSSSENSRYPLTVALIRPS